MVTSLKLARGCAAILLLISCASLPLAVPPQKRIVNRLTWPDEPVQIIAIKTKGKAIEFDKPFAGKNNWLGDLSFVIKNTSTKSVSWARVALSFRRKEGGARLVDGVTYGIGRWDEDKLRGGGPPLKPGESAEVAYSQAQFQSTREILDGMGYPKSIAQIEVGVDQVIFTDQPELMWIEGRMNEFHSPTGWRPVKP